MKTILSPKTLAALLLAFSCSQASAQMSMARQTSMNVKRYMNARANGKKLKSYLSYEIGYHLPISQATFSHTFVNEVDGMYTGEKTISRNVTAKGMGADASVYCRLFDVTEKSSVAFSYGVVANIVKYDIGAIKPSATQTYNYEFNSGQAAIPLCIDYKYGGEAIYDKAERVSFTAGFGISPMMYISNFGNAAEMKFGLRPYVHAEVGFFAAIEWKIKASCIMGNANIYKADSDTPGMEGMPYASRITMTSKPVFNIGFTLMPFSWDWENSRW